MATTSLAKAIQRMAVVEKAPIPNPVTPTEAIPKAAAAEALAQGEAKKGESREGKDEERKGKPHYHKKRTSKNSNSQNSTKRVKGGSGKPRLFPTISEDEKTVVWWKDYTPNGRVRDTLLSSNVCDFLRSYGTEEIL